MDAATGKTPARAGFIESHINMPVWLKPKLEPLLTKAQSKESFMQRICDIWPPMSEECLLISRAYDAAQKTFRHTNRDSGENYFTDHLRASALIAVVYLRIRDANVIASILLHDCIEDYPDEWSFDRIVKEFNLDIAHLVWWVTKEVEEDGQKLTKAQADRKYHRRLMRAPRRAMFVKLPERLHNMITIWSQPTEKIMRKVSETQDFIVPLAESHHILVQEFEDVLKCIEDTLNGKHDAC